MRALVVTALILAHPRWSTAEINMADSIEWITADSRRVVVGKVTRVQVHSEITGSRFGPGEQPRAGLGSEVRSLWFHATIAVSKTLKGPATKTIDIVVRHGFGDHHPAAWKQANREVLLFLIEAKDRAARDGDRQARYDSAPYALRAGRHGDDAYLLDGTARLYSSTFDVLSKRAPVLAAVGAAASSAATRSMRLDLPLDSPAGRALWGGSAVFLDVPIDAALEQRAIQWIAAPDASLREQGAGVLAHFKSPANIRRLEALLQDTATHEVTEGDRPTVRRYFVRRRAHQILVGWGVPHTTPPIETAP